MTLKILRSEANAAVYRLVQSLFNGATEEEYGKLVLYKGTRPAAIDVAVPDTDIVVQYNLLRGGVNVAFEYVSDPVNAKIRILGLLPKLADQSGEVTFFRLLSNADPRVTVVEGTVTDRNGSGELKLSTTNILVGIYVKVASAEISIPIEI